MAEYDIVGSMDLVGADYEVGARGRRGGMMRGGGGRFAGVRAVEVAPGPPRVLMIGFPTFGAIGVGLAVTQTVRPQKQAFRVDRLLIPVLVAGILITTFAVGVENVFGNVGGEVDALAFSNNAVSTSLQAATAEKGTDIVLTLLNSTAGAVTVRGVVIFGIAV